MEPESRRTITSYRDLRVWQVAMDLAVECYRISKSFPASEIYGLTSQIRRSAGSVPANIAEGYGREATGSYVQHLRIAQGSLKELETHLILSERVGIANEDELRTAFGLSDEAGKMLRGLVRSLQNR